VEKPLVSIVIPNWNGVAHLPGCLDALCRQTYTPLEVTVADNASNDGSQALVREKYPPVRVVQMETNQGFTGACNAGIRASTGDIVILLNNDTEVAPDWVAEVVAAFERHPDAGLVASKMLLFDRRDTLHTAGDIVYMNGLPANRGVWQPDGEQYSHEEYVFSACGGSAAYRKEMLAQVGLLDDDFFFSCEDIDLAWRAQLAGWKCVYAPRAVVYHRLAATGGGATASFFDGRNFLWVIVKDIPGALIRKHWRDIAGAQLRLAGEALRAWRGAAARARLRGMAAGLLTLPGVLAKRRKVQSTRTASIEYIESILTPVGPGREGVP
jgi:GT2 family glycosyltransferase